MRSSIGMLSVLEDHTGRLQRVEGRLTSLAARFAVIETFDHEVALVDQNSMSMDGVSRESRTRQCSPNLPRRH